MAKRHEDFGSADDVAKSFGATLHTATKDGGNLVKGPCPVCQQDQALWLEVHTDFWFSLSFQFCKWCGDATSAMGREARDAS